MKLHKVRVQEYKFREVQDRGIRAGTAFKNSEFKVGDLLKFVRPDGDVFYSGDENLFKITYILTDIPEDILNKDYCIVGFKKVEIVDLE